MRLPAVVALGMLAAIGLFAQPALAGCPANAYESGRTETADKIRVKCRCDLGFKYRGGQCKRYISLQILVKATPFVVVTKKGDVRALVKRGGFEFKVKVKNALAATDIATGPDSHVVFQLAGGKRLAIGPNSKLELGDKRDGYDLNIKSARGVFRLKEPKASSNFPRFGKLAERAFRYAIMWKKGLTRRFRIRTPNVALAARATDFVLTGSPNGDLTIGIIEGAVDLIPNKAGSGPTVTIKAGERWLISRGGKIKQLAKLGPAEMLGRWTARTGLEDLPFYGK